MKIKKTSSIVYFILVATVFVFLSSCKEKNKEKYNTHQVTIVEAKGYVVPRDSMSVPKVIPVDESKLLKIPAGKPTVIPTNLNIHTAGEPKLIYIDESKLRIITPGTDTFPLPQIVPAIDSPFVAGIPEVVVAKDMGNKDENSANFSYFNKLQGLKHGDIRCILEDREGNLWFGTEGGGASKYDGKSFTHFTDRQGLSNKSVLSMLEDKSGNLWFGTNGGGVSKYDGKSFTHFTERQGLSNNIVYSIIEDKSGNFWFGTGGGGVTKYDGKSFTHFSEKQGLSNNDVRRIMEDQSGNLWFGTKGGVSKYDGKRFTHFTEKEGLSNNYVWSILQDKSGNFWFGTDGGGVSKYDGKCFRNFTQNEGLSNNSVLSILEDKSGNLWFGTGTGGVSKYDRESFTHFTEKEGLSNNYVWSMLEDKSENLWFGTGSGGVSKYDGKRFTHFTEKEGLSNNSVWGILEDQSGNLWFGTNGGGVSKYDGNRFTIFTQKQGLSSYTVLSILQDKNENIWFGTSGGGVSKYDGKCFTHFTTKEGLCDNVIKSIIEDKNGNLWFGSYGGGVSKYDGKSFTNFTEKAGLSNNSVWSMLEDKNGNLWFGTGGGGVSKYDGKQFTRFSEKEGLSNNYVYCIIEDKSGNLYFGTNGGGVSKYNGNQFTYFTEKAGLSSNSVLSILEDKSENLWFGTRFGLCMLSKTKLVEMSEKIKSNTLLEHDVFFKNFTYQDGFLGIGCWRNSILEAKDGTIWIGANDRLTVYHPPIGGNLSDTIAPNIQVNSIDLFNEKIAWNTLEQKKDTSFVLGNGVTVGNFKFDGISKWYSLPENLSLAYNNNYLTFNFIGITMDQPQNVKYLYKLEGIDDNWSALTKTNSAPYGNLPQGDYIFKVKAMNSDGYWSKEFNYSFIIRPPWWKTWWAYTLYALAFITGISLFIYYRTASLINQKKILEQTVEARTKSLKESQAQLVQSEKMASLGQLTAGVAHELNNPINFVSANILPLQRDFEDVKEVLEKYESTIATHQLAGKFNDVASLKKEKDFSYTLQEIGTLIKGMQDGATRTTEIVKGLRNFSRLDEGEFKNANLYEGIESSLMLLHNLLDKRKIEVVKTLNPIPEVKCYPGQINQVFMNLLTNAIDAIGENGKITITTSQQKDKVKISFRDTGKGMSEEVKQKIFDPFFTTKDVGKGAGLGLSISYGIIEKHKGKIEVNSEVGKGSEFVITLPI